MKETITTKLQIVSVMDAPLTVWNGADLIVTNEKRKWTLTENGVTVKAQSLPKLSAQLGEGRSIRVVGCDCSGYTLTLTEAV